MAAETFPPGEFIREELEARGWTQDDLALRLEWENYEVARLAVAFLVDAPVKGMIMGAPMSADLGRVFGVSPEFFLNLDRSWQPENYPDA